MSLTFEDPDILWAARVMIARHGEEAANRAGRRVDQLAEDGDIEASDLWDRVLAVIVELQRRRGDGDALN